MYLKTTRCSQYKWNMQRIWFRRGRWLMSHASFLLIKEWMRFIAHDGICMYHFYIHSELEFLIILAGIKFYEYEIRLIWLVQISEVKMMLHQYCWFLNNCYIFKILESEKLCWWLFNESVINIWTQNTHLSLKFIWWKLNLVIRTEKSIILFCKSQSQRN